MKDADGDNLSGYQRAMGVSAAGVVYVLDDLGVVAVNPPRG